MQVKASRHEGVKCPRCWNYHWLRDTFDGLCDRCQAVILEEYPGHEAVPHIKSAMRAEMRKYCKRGEGVPCPNLRCCRAES